MRSSHCHLRRESSWPYQKSEWSPELAPASGCHRRRIRPARRKTGPAGPGHRWVRGCTARARTGREPRARRTYGHTRSRSGGSGHRAGRTGVGAHRHVGELRHGDGVLPGEQHDTRGIQVSHRCHLMTRHMGGSTEPGFPNLPDKPFFLGIIEQFRRWGGSIPPEDVHETSSLFVGLPFGVSAELHQQPSAPSSNRSSSSGCRRILCMALTKRSSMPSRPMGRCSKISRTWSPAW